MKKVSAIVVNWNGEDVLSGCLASLLEQDYENLEILAVDNGAEDGSKVLSIYKFVSIITASFSNYKKIPYKKILH